MRFKTFLSKFVYLVRIQTQPNTPTYAYTLIRVDDPARCKAETECGSSMRLFMCYIHARHTTCVIFVNGPFFSYEFHDFSSNRIKIDYNYCQWNDFSILLMKWFKWFAVIHVWAIQSLRQTAPFGTKMKVPKCTQKEVSFASQSIVYFFIIVIVIFVQVRYPMFVNERVRFDCMCVA